MKHYMLTLAWPEQENMSAAAEASVNISSAPSVPAAVSDSGTAAVWQMIPDLAPHFEGNPLP